MGTKIITYEFKILYFRRELFGYVVWESSRGGGEAPPIEGTNYLHSF